MNRDMPPLDSTPAESSGSSPGTVLRRCREFHGISLEEAAETTKIGISHLKALEDDNIREFANQAYLKGFLRIYATFLGLNSNDLARMYDKIFGLKEEIPGSGRSAATSSHSPRRFITLKKLLYPSILLAIILVTATFFKRPPAPLVRQPKQVEAVALSPQETAIQKVQSSVRIKSIEREIQVPPEDKRPADRPVPPEKPVVTKRLEDTASGFVLKIKVIQNGLLSSTVDGGGLQQYELTVGDVIEWKAEKKVTLDLTNAGGVEIELNGKPYKSLGPPGKAVYVELDADGIRQ